MAISKKFKIKKGISIIEILIVISIILVALTSLLGIATFSLRISTLIKETTKANNLAQEVIEAVRNFRDGTDWNINGLGVLTSGVSYFPQKTADNHPKWQMVQGEETVNGFTKKVVFEKVFRDADDNISSSGTEDPNTKKATISVSWKEKKVAIVTYFTNWK